MAVKFAAALLLLVGLAGCAGQAGWDRPGASAEANRRDLAACSAEANAVAARPGGQPSLFDPDPTYGESRQSYFEVDRHVTGDPANRLRDDAAEARLRDCLESRGFHPAP
jgi:hypothetical protein